MSSYAGFGLQQWENPETMSRYRKLTTACLAAAVALGLAACGSSGDGTSSTTPPPTTTPPPVATACPGTDAASHTACVGEKKAAMDAAKKALDAAKADQSSTQAQIAAAQKAYDDAMKAHTDAVAAQNKYAAMQPPGYDLKALETAVKKQATTSPVSLGGGLVVDNSTNNNVSGGEVEVTTGTPAVNTYSKATWPVGELAGFNESVWERKTPTNDSVVVYTNIQANKAGKYTAYYVRNTSETPTAGMAPGFSWVPWAGIQSVQDNDDGILLLKNSGLGTKEYKLFSADSLPDGSLASQKFIDDTTTTADERKFKGTFNGVSGMFVCSHATECAAANNRKGNLDSLSPVNAWTFVPDSTNVSVAGVQKDADFLDFGYWVETTTAGGETSYKAAAFYRGEMHSGAVNSVTGSATYKGGAAGLFTRRTITADSNTLTSGGRFTADASLTAHFSGTGVAVADQNSISGTISNFKDGAGNLIDPVWSLSLMKVQAGNSSAVPAVPSRGTWSGDATSGTHFSGETTGGGSWSGSFYGSTGSDNTAAPSSVAGQFTGAFNNGNVMGSFGATK